MSDITRNEALYCFIDKIEFCEISKTSQNFESKKELLVAETI